MQQSAKVADAALDKVEGACAWITGPINRRFQRRFSFCSFCCFFIGLCPAFSYWGIAFTNWSNSCQEPLETFLFVEGLLFSTIYFVSAYMLSTYGKPMNKEEGEEDDNDEEKDQDEERRKRAKDYKHGEVLDEKGSDDDLNARLAYMFRDPILWAYFVIILFGVVWTVLGHNWWILVTTDDQGDPGFTDNSVCVRDRPHLINGVESAVILFWTYLGIAFVLGLMFTLYLCRKGPDCFYDEEERRVREEDRRYKMELEEREKYPNGRPEEERTDIKRPGKTFSKYPWRDRNEQRARMEQRQQLGSALLSQEGIDQNPNRGDGPRTIIMGGDPSRAIRIYRDVSVQSGQSTLQGRICVDNAAAARVHVGKPYRDPNLARYRAQLQSRREDDSQETNETPEKKKSNPFKRMGTKIKGVFKSKKKTEESNPRNFRSEVINYNGNQKPQEGMSKSFAPPMAREKTFISRSERGSNITEADAVYFQDVVVEEIPDRNTNSRGRREESSEDNDDLYNPQKPSANRDHNTSTCSTVDYSYYDPNDSQSSDAANNNSSMMVKKGKERKSAGGKTSNASETGTRRAEDDSAKFDGSRKKTVNDPLATTDAGSSSTTAGDPSLDTTKKTAVKVSKSEKVKNKLGLGHKPSTSGTELQAVALTVARERQDDDYDDTVRYDAYLRSEQQKEQERVQNESVSTLSLAHGISGIHKQSDAAASTTTIGTMKTTTTSGDEEARDDAKQLAKKERMRRLLEDIDDEDETEDDSAANTTTLR